MVCKIRCNKTNGQFYYGFMRRLKCFIDHQDAKQVTGNGKSLKPAEPWRVKQKSARGREVAPG